MVYRYNYLVSKILRRLRMTGECIKFNMVGNNPFRNYRGGIFYARV
jgi:hypothetical protein